MAASPHLVGVAADRVARSARGRVAVVRGADAENAAATAEHGDALLGLGEVLRRHFHGPLGGGGATIGGWWILAEVDIETAAHEIVRPDLVGWRRERMTDRPRGRPQHARPDWVCEVRSALRNDRPSSLLAFERDCIAYYWRVDPDRGTLTAHRWTEEGYRVTLQAHRWQLFQAEPFDAIEVRASCLFGDE